MENWWVWVLVILFFLGKLVSEASNSPELASAKKAWKS